MSTPEPGDFLLTARLITQFRDLIALLETVPGLPLGEFGVTYHAESAEAVDEAARMLGVATVWNEGRTHYRATRQIGPDVAYEALFITPESMAAYERHMERFHRDETDGEATS